MSDFSRRAFFARAAQVAVGVAGLLAGCSAPAATTPTTGPTSASTTPPKPVSTATAPGVAIAPATAATSVSPATAVPSTAAAAPKATASASGGPPAQLAVVRGDKPAAITRAAVEALGGIGQFVLPGQRVLVKPNICTSRAPEYAATTNPEVVATVVALCLEAGAAKVVVMDQGFSGANTSYRVSGIEAAVKAAGGEMEVYSRLKLKKTPIPQGKDIKSWSIYEDALTYDVLINVPIGKSHDVADLTLGMKNLMGLIDDRGGFHGNIGQRLADLGTVIRPKLIIVDAVRILVRNGPTGGNLRDV